MNHLKQIIIAVLISITFCNDGQGPLFTNIDISEDFFQGNPIKIEVQAMDPDEVSEVILYYRFSDNQDYKNLSMDFDINYYTVIPSFEIESNKLEYYFVGIDKYNNQTQYPENYNLNPLVINMVDGLDDYEIYLISPIVDSESSDVSIIILSLFGSNNINLKHIEISLDGNSITEDCNISKDMITYVPPSKLDDGQHQILFTIKNENNISSYQEFNFDIKKDELSTSEVIDDWVNQVSYSGSIDYSSDYDKFTYNDIDITQPDSRPLDIHRINFNLKAKYKQINFQSSLLFNTHILDADARLSKSDKQPIDRMKIGLQFPYGIINFGDYSTSFSDLTLKGTRVRGLHTSLNIGFFKMTYIRGKTRELIQSEHISLYESNNPDNPGIELNDGSFLLYDKGTPSRNLRAFRAEFNFNQRINFGFSGLTAYDVQDVDIPYPELYSNYLFTGNSVIGSDATLFFNNKRTWLSLETAISLTNNILEDNINNYLINDLGMSLTENQQWAIGALEDLLGYPITTDLLLAKGDGRGLSIPNPIDTTTNEVAIDGDYIKRIFKEGTYQIKFKSPFSIYNAKFDLRTEYKRIPFSFTSYGSPSVPKDIQGLSADLKIKLLNNRLIISMGYDNESDNVNDYQESTTTSSGNNVGASLNFTNFPSFSYSRKYLNRLDDSGLVNNATVTHTISPSYKFNIKNMRLGLNSNVVLMDYNDSLGNEDINNNFSQSSVSNSLSISGKKLGMNIGLGYSNNNPDDTNKFETIFYAFSSKISYKFKGNKLNSYIGFNQVFGQKDDPDNQIKNYKTSIKAGSQYKINKYSSIKYNIEYLLYADKVETSNNYSEFKGKLSMKINF